MQRKNYPTNIKMDFDVFKEKGGGTYNALTITVNLNHNKYNVEDVRRALEKAFKEIMTHYTDMEVEKCQ